MRSPTLILCYHRVCDDAEDPFHLVVSPEHFAQHLAMLSRRAAFIGLDEAILPADHSRVVLTFDDGYADNLIHAAPIARELGAPMTVYVTSGLVGDPVGFWWDRLAYIVHRGCNQVVEARLTIKGESVPVRLGDPSGAPQVIAELRDRLRLCAADEIDQVLGSLEAQVGVDPAVPPDARPLTVEELRELNNFENVTIGAHTTRHVQLLNRSFDAQFETISRSKQDLEAALNVEVRHFAYPFGGPDAFDAISVAAVRRAGFATATTTFPGSIGSSPDPLRLRRRLVMDWSPWRFRAQMVRWGLL